MNDADDDADEATDEDAKDDAENNAVDDAGDEAEDDADEIAEVYAENDAGENAEDEAEDDTKEESNAGENAGMDAGDDFAPTPTSVVIIDATFLPVVVDVVPTGCDDGFVVFNSIIPIRGVDNDASSPDTVDAVGDDDDDVEIGDELKRGMCLIEGTAIIEEDN